jgi:hypothetical protein
MGMEPFRTAGGYHGQGDEAVGWWYTRAGSLEKEGKGGCDVRVRRWKCVGRETARKVFVDRSYTCELTL